MFARTPSQTLDVGLCDDDRRPSFGRPGGAATEGKEDQAAQRQEVQQRLTQQLLKHQMRAQLLGVYQIGDV